jgi:hypothetical protein
VSQILASAHSIGSDSQLELPLGHEITISPQAFSCSPTLCYHHSHFRFSNSFLFLDVIQEGSAIAVLRHPNQWADALLVPIIRYSRLLIVDMLAIYLIHLYSVISDFLRDSPMICLQ